MEDIVSVIRGIVREELKSLRTTELGVVTKLCSHESGGDMNNYACSVRLRDSELELQNVGIATQRIGLVAIPNINDLVLVQFIGGDVNNAVIAGRLYNDEDRPPEAKPREWVYVSPDGNESGIKRLYMEFPNGNKALLDDDKLFLEVGGTSIKLKHDGDIEIVSNAKLKIETQSEVSVEANGNIKLDSQGNIDIKALGTLSLEATDVSIKGRATSSLEGSATTSIKGGMITVSGNISVSP